MLVDELLAHCFVCSHALVILADYSFVVRKVDFWVIYNFGWSYNFVHKIFFVYKAAANTLCP